MSDLSTQNRKSGTSGQVKGGANPASNEVALIIPEETQSKYPQLVEDIKESKSMDNKERNYWLQVLPVMTEEQVEELKDILSTEKRKLAEIEKKYATPDQEKSPKKSPEQVKKEQEKVLQWKKEQKQKELLARKKENVDDILSQLAFV